MNTTREIRRRIKSIGATTQITRAMQMVASSKMRKAQQAALTAAPFARALYRIQRHAATRAVDFTHPLLEVREVRTRAVILVGPDRGLCGALNTNLFRVAAQFDPRSTTFIAAGEKAAQFVARTGRRLAAEFSYADSPRFAEARAIAAFVRELFLTRTVDEVVLVGTRFIHTLAQEPVAFVLLPVGALKGLNVPNLEDEEVLADDTREWLFEPSAESVLGYLLGHYLNISVYFLLLQAKASEQSARMVSMKAATDSANNLIQDLTLEYNKLRQESITAELIDIAGGQAH